MGIFKTDPQKSTIQHVSLYNRFIFGKERNNSSQVPRPSPFRQTWTLRDVTERDGDWHRSFIRLFSDNEARENAWGLGWGGIIYSMACGIHMMGTSWPAIYSIKYKFKKMAPEAYGQNSNIRAFSVLFSLANMVTYSKQLTEDCNSFE